HQRDKNENDKADRGKPLISFV
ncbi:MAG: hypothetical protein JWQ25_2168, partial [Daejeonella sp.]|nr:hypothetical protein [Daejeonella sp.]